MRGPGERVLLECAGFKLSARVVWAQGGRVGIAFDTSITEKLFTAVAELGIRRLAPAMPPHKLN
jgi:hypothetical protein